MNRRSPVKTTAQIAEALRYSLVSPNVADSNLEPANVVDVLHDFAHALHNLGMVDASTDMGAIEAHALAVKEGSEAIAASLSQVADAITDLAAAVRDHGTPPRDATERETGGADA